MKRIAFVRSWWFVALVGIGVVLISYLVFGRTETYSYETERVSAGTVTGMVSGTGVVEDPGLLTLAFEVGGTIETVSAGEGMRVAAGDVIATLVQDARSTDRVAAQARVDAEEARLAELIAGVDGTDRTAAEQAVTVARLAVEQAEASYVDVVEREDLAVETARSTLLTSGLVAVSVGNLSSSDTFVATPPTISGTYHGAGEGEYRITLYRSNAKSGYSFRFDGLESGSGTVSTSQPEPLGSSGLFIQFPEQFSRGSSVEWLVEIPNTRASTYAANALAYERALATRESALRDAQARVETAQAALAQAIANRDVRVVGSREERIDAQRAALRVAIAQRDATDVALSAQVLRAPSDGVISALTAKVGKVVTPHAPIATLVSDAPVEIVFRVPEVDVAELSVGNTALVTFDAYPDQEYEATVISIAPAAEIVNGVATFRTILYIQEPDARIRVGFSAEVDIVTSVREAVLAVPGRAVVRSEGRTVVRVVDEGSIVEREVETGIRGADGRVEIVSGLAEGEEVVTYIPPDELAALLR